LRTTTSQKGIGSDAGSYLRLIDCVYHSTLGLRVIKKRKEKKKHLEQIAGRLDSAPPELLADARQV